MEIEILKKMIYHDSVSWKLLSNISNKLDKMFRVAISNINTYITNTWYSVNDLFQLL
jgi:hypothetical protein